MTVELSVLPWPAAICEAGGALRVCNARWQTRFGRCDDLGRDFPEAAQQLRALTDQRAPGEAPAENGASVSVRAPGEIAPLLLRFAALPAPQAPDSPALWLVLVSESSARLPPEQAPPAPSKSDEMRDVELAMDGVAMRLQARNWRAFFHDAAAGKALIGLHGETLEVNGALCQLMGHSEHELLNIFARDLRHPEDLALVDEHYQLLIGGGPPIAGVEARYRHKDGRYLSCLLSLSLIRDSRQRPLYYAVEIEDITSRRQAEAQLRAQAQELERANSELTRSNSDLERFAFVASHDLQEPLRKIRVFGDRLEMLVAHSPQDSSQNSALDADIVRYIRVMTGAAHRMQNLVDDLLAYGRLKQRDTPFVPVDLNALWDELREEFETTLRESGAQLQVGALPEVRGNPFRLRQLFGNLLSNALKFRGEAPPIITVSAPASLQSPQFAAIEVEDNGIGFDQAHAEAIFNVFARLHGRSRYPGTGIGLAICRRVAGEHGGDVRAFARESQGARFVVTLEI